MEMFDVHRRDLFDFDEYMNLKNPGFGGPSSAIPERDEKGKRIKKEIKLEGYRNVVERHPAFSHEVWNPTYKAMGSDLVYKQDVGENPYDYPDRYENMGIPVVEVGERETNESKVLSYEDYMNLNEQRTAPAPTETPTETPTEEPETPTTPARPGTRPGTPSRPPRRRVNPAPKNTTDPALVDELASELGIPKEEAEWLLSDETLPEDPMMYDDSADVDYSDDDYQMGMMGEDEGCGCNP